MKEKKQQQKNEEMSCTHATRVICAMLDRATAREHMKMLAEDSGQVKGQSSGGHGGTVLDVQWMRQLVSWATANWLQLLGQG